MLSRLKESHFLGLLSNFTHPPAARKIIQQAGLTGFFHVVLISGDLGYRKPHPAVFDRLAEQLNVKKNQILYIGDDPEADVIGAQQAGLRSGPPMPRNIIWHLNPLYLPKPLRYRTKVHSAFQTGKTYSPCLL